MREKVDLPAITVKEIKGPAISTISVGTKFTVTWIDHNTLGNSLCHSACEGLGCGITEVWNDEFEIIKGD